MSKEFDNWWSSLTILQKERIAGKIATKQKGEPTEVPYPECTKWWIALDADSQKRIHDHCVDAHGYLLPEYKEGTIYNY